MNIKFESDETAVLQELHQYIYTQNKEIIIDEHYEMIPGVNKEPVVTTLIATIVSAPVLNFIKNIVKEFIALKTVNAKEKTKQLKDKQVHAENVLKIYLQNGGKWEAIKLEELTTLKIEN